MKAEKEMLESRKELKDWLVCGAAARCIKYEACIVFRVLVLYKRYLLHWLVRAISNENSEEKSWCKV